MCLERVLPKPLTHLFQKNNAHTVYDNARTCTVYQNALTYLRTHCSGAAAAPAGPALACLRPLHAVNQAQVNAYLSLTTVNKPAAPLHCCIREQLMRVWCRSSTVVSLMQL